MDPEANLPNHDGPDLNGPVHLRVEHVYPALLAIAMARLRDVDAAEDLAQEVVVRGLLRIDQLRDPARLEAWLIRLQDAQRQFYVERQHQIKERGFLPVMWPQLIVTALLLVLWFYIFKTILLK